MGFNLWEGYVRLVDIQEKNPFEFGILLEIGERGIKFTCYLKKEEDATYTTEPRWLEKRYRSGIKFE